MIFNLNIRQLLINGKLLFIFICTAIAIGSILLSGRIAEELRSKELQEVRLWSMAISQLGNGKYDSQDQTFRALAMDIVGTNNTIPSIMTDENLKVLSYRNIPKNIAKDPEKLQHYITRMARSNNPIIINGKNGNKHYIFYKESSTLMLLKIFPLIQLCIIGIFILFSYITMRSSIRNQQNMVWIGMAKETAHQLGSPTSSLLGWLEYLKTQNTDPIAIEEINKDISRLLKVVDRFSKIGSTTKLEPRNIQEIINGCVSYFEKRIPKNATLTYINNERNPLQARVNDILFDWVIENLIKNAIDAVQGKGSIIITTYDDDKHIYIDVTDTGKGMPKSSFEKIFTPGFTTKTRGWGLGLSLSRRIIKEYHKGRIYVAHSEIDKGTTMRVELNRL